MSLSTQPYKGARDFYPADKRRQQYMFGVWRQVCESFGYEEYDAPILEPLELYVSKTSDEVVNEQTYTFTDRGDRQVVMRPEMTPSVSRMVAAKRQELGYPLRLYSIPNCFRYERPQRGRLREFWQLNADIFGVESAEADIEIICMADAILKAFGATPEMYSINISSRKFMNDVFDSLNIDQTKRNQLIGLIDKKEKVAAPDWEQLFYDQLDKDTADKLLDELRQESAPAEITELLEALKARGVTSVKFNKYLARGFDYYTDIVFEVFDTDTDNNRSMFGGGRYDGLVGQFGVEPIPTVGFGMGDITLENFLVSNGLMPSLAPSTDITALLMGGDSAQATEAVQQLRDMGLNVAVDFSDRKPDKQIKAAVKRDVPFVLFIGEAELSSGQFTLKELATGTEEKLSLEQIAERISQDS